MEIDMAKMPAPPPIDIFTLSIEGAELVDERQKQSKEFCLNYLEPLCNYNSLSAKYLNEASKKLHTVASACRQEALKRDEKSKSTVSDGLIRSLIQKLRGSCA